LEGELKMGAVIQKMLDTSIHESLLNLSLLFTIQVVRFTVRRFVLFSVATLVGATSGSRKAGPFFGLIATMIATVIATRRLLLQTFFDLCDPRLPEFNLHHSPTVNL